MPWVWRPDKLRAARIAAGLSQRLLAERCCKLGYDGFHPRQHVISYIEAGLNIPNADGRWCLAEALGLVVDELHEHVTYADAVLERLKDAPWQEPRAEVTD